MNNQRNFGKKVMSILLCMTLILSGFMVPAKQVKADNQATPYAGELLPVSTADFTFTAPTDLVYGQAIPNDMVTGKDGMGAITYKFYLETAPDILLDAPLNAGTYRVAIDVAAGTTYASATDITSDDWIFTVGKANFNSMYITQIWRDGANWCYDGTDKSEFVMITTMDGITGYGEVTKRFYKDGVETPLVNVGTYQVVFDVAEGINYNAVTDLTWQYCEVLIYKAPTAPNMPDATMDVLYSKKTVDAVTLPDGWVWSENDSAQELSVGEVVEATAIYNGADKGNYETESVTISITRRDCVHEESEILYTGEGEKSPTCKEAGIGHTECIKCQELMQTQVSVEASGHTGGTATCKNKAECSVCHEAYGELDKNKHVGETLVKDAKEATCAVEGYTGDTYCKDCGAKIAFGTVIPKSTVHTWDEGVVTKEPTPLAKGEKTHTCTVCKITRTEEIAALGAPEVGTKHVSDDGKATYKVTKSDLKKGTVTYVAPTNKKATVATIPATVQIDGVTYKVTAIEKNAFKKNKNLKTVTIGKNVKTIGKSAFEGCKKVTSVTIGKSVEKIGEKAFYGCSKVKILTIQSTKLTTKKIGNKAFTKTPKTMTVKIPKKKFKTYKSMLIKKGVNKKAKFKKK